MLVVQACCCLVVEGRPGHSSHRTLRREGGREGGRGRKGRRGREGEREEGGRGEREGRGRGRKVW